MNAASKSKSLFSLVLISILVIFQAGITSAYQEKPCLNPYDPGCPVTAPNKATKQVSCLI
jgi:hypothetical protein